MPLKDYSGETIQYVSINVLPLSAGIGPRTTTTMTNVLVIKAHFSYNGINGRLTLNNLKAVTSTYHLKMKFSKEAGVGEVHGEHVLARECYVQELTNKGRDVHIAASSGSGKASPSPPPELIEHGIETWDKQSLK